MRKELVVRLLALAALSLGAFAAFAGSPRSDNSIAAAKVAHEVETEADHVTAVELARWIRDRKRDLRVIDIRDSAEFEEFHIPLAERMSIEKVVTASFKPAETIVLYSGGGAHAAQAWVLLRARGERNVFFLRGGAAEWIAEVLNPQIPGKPTGTEKQEWDSLAALSRYFGGVPRQVDSAVPSEAFKASIVRVRGRGC